MKQFIFLFLSFFCLFSAGQNSNNPGKKKSQNTQQKKSKQAKSARPVAWAYAGKNGPTNWGNLSPVYALCSKGKTQSPIDIQKTEVEGGVHWNFNYKSGRLKITHNEHVDDIIDNGYTIQVSVEEGGTFTLKGKVYHLKQFHFHTPSEHSIDGKHFPMEVHFVHRSDSGDLAVVSIFVEEGVENENIAKIIANLPSKKGDSKHMKETELVLQFHLQKITEAYHYLGSLTTPPCSENVEWLVFKTPIQASKEQIAAISSKIGPNNRPTQELNERTVKSDVLKGKISD